jgi:phosphoenolpyruvate---glycerone phosphotransferase subunit DhaK
MARLFGDTEDSLLTDALAGFASGHADLVDVHPAGFVQARHRSPSRRVGLVSGGGSGHEPLHIGFVGAGMLDAACPGRIFASPHNRQIFEASLAVAGEEGVLHIVKNYTGDRINFGIAAERLAHQGVPCARVLVDDDVSTESESIAVGRRGTAATVLVEKVLGAAADAGWGLEQLREFGTALAARCRSTAVASGAHTSPATGMPAFGIPLDALEYGVGIHGERAARTREWEPLDVLVDTMTDALWQSLGSAAAGPLVVLVNGLGAVTRLELYAVLRALEPAVQVRGGSIVRSLVGDFVTALDMRGFSITLLACDGRTLEFYDAPARTAAWPSQR